MSGLIKFALVLAAALVSAAGASAQADPRLEQERLTKADMALARQITVRSTDLGPGWRRVTLPAQKREPLSCPGFAPDFSAFTITGRAESGFGHRSGASLVSAVEIYPNRRQAVGDFALGTRPASLPCLKLMIQRELDAVNDLSFTARVVSARLAPAPRVGERAVYYRFVARIKAGGEAVAVHVDLLAFRKGRSIAVLTFMAALEPLAGQAAVARAVAARMR